MSDHLLFSPIQIGSRRLRNRIVRSATYEGMATPEGVITPAYQKLYCNQCAVMCDTSTKTFCY